MTIPKKACVILSVSILCSCTSNTPYPNNWPTIDNTQKQNCSDLEGSYKNYNGEKYLSDLLGIKDIALNKKQQLQLNILNENSLQIILTGDKKEISKYEITSDNNGYSCDMGVIHFHGIREYYSHPWVIATSRAHIKLYMAEDQSIIAEIKHKLFTLAMMILPVASNNTEWRKWEKLD